MGHVRNYVITDGITSSSGMAVSSTAPNGMGMHLRLALGKNAALDRGIPAKWTHQNIACDAAVLA